ncbi:hypothetical protein OIU89_26400 [Escherichia coli]|nr:hypothetical protein [Escherichia coli]
MEMLKSTSDAVEEKPEQKMLDQRNHLSLTLARRVSRQSKPGKAKPKSDTEKQPHKPEAKRFVPSGHCQKRTTFGKRQSVTSTQGCWGWTGDIDFPFDAFSASAETASTDATNSEIPDVAMPGKQEKQPKQDFVPQEQNSLQGDDFPMFSSSDEPPSWAIEPLLC